MEYAAIDLHKKESQIRIVLENGGIVDQRIATTRDRLTAVFWGRARMRILLEASTESEWVAQHLETIGHEVIVADPNVTPMYSHRSRRIKTDRRDVAALAEACQRGFYRAAHRRSARVMSENSIGAPERADGPMHGRRLTQSRSSQAKAAERRPSGE
jgi:transposase